MGMQTDNVPLEGRDSTAQLISRINRDLDRLQRDIHEVTVRLDAMIPDADDRRHYDDHVDIRDVRADRRKLWGNLRSQGAAGVMMAIGAGLMAVIVYAVQQFVKTRGG